MGSGPLDQIVGLAIDRVPDSEVVMRSSYQQDCGKHRLNMVNGLASSELPIGTPCPRGADIGKGAGQRGFKLAPALGIAALGL